MLTADKTLCVKRYFQFSLLVSPHARQEDVGIWTDTCQVRNILPQLCNASDNSQEALMSMHPSSIYPPGSFCICILFPVFSLTIYGLLTKREVKMAGYWPSSFFACLWTETKSRSLNTQKKKNEANIQPF